MGITKKRILFPIIFIAIIAVSFAAVLDAPDFACAEYGDDFGYSVGNDCDVQISYHYYNEYMAGVYFAYEVKFDKDFYAAVADKKALIASVKDTFVKNGFSIDEDVDNGKMTAYLSYPSLTDYYISQGEDGYETGEAQKPSKKTLFYSDYTSTFQTVFVGIKTEGRFVNRIYNACVAAGIPDEKMTLSYVYGTPYSEQMITSSADKVTYSATERMYYHQFDMSVSENAKYITINQHVPNSAGWYLIAVIIGLVVLAVPLTVLIVKKKRRD